MKCTCPTPAFCVGTQGNLYSTGWRRGLASGKTQSLALGNAKIYQHVGISNAKFWRRGHCPTPAPDARYFAFWWNIGFRPPLNEKWFPVHRPSRLKRADWNFIFFIYYYYYFFFFSYFQFIHFFVLPPPLYILVYTNMKLGRKKENDFRPTGRFFLLARWTGNYHSPKGGGYLRV